MADVELLPLPEPLLVRGDIGGLYTGRECQHHARACVEANIAPLQAENERLRAKTAVTMGVGTGDGKLFVHGDYESIKAAQEIVLERDALRAEVERLQDSVNRLGLEGGQFMSRTATAEARAERLAEALRWYAEQAQLCRKFGSEGDAARHALSADGGKRANRALAQEDRND